MFLILVKKFEKGEEGYVIRNKIDSEWMSLIVEAKNIGMTVQEIRQFLCNERKECLFSHSCPLLNCGEQ